jgi:hypothetical protein
MLNNNATFLEVRKIYRKTRIIPWLVVKTRVYPAVKKCIVWNLTWREDSKNLSLLTGRSNILKNPLRLPFEHIQEINSTLHNDLFNYNPTIVLQDSKVKIFWRISNTSNKPTINWLGFRKDLNTKKNKI